MEGKIEFHRDLNRTLLRVRMAGIREEDYQTRMLRQNDVKGLLPIHMYGEGEETIYEYDVSGRLSMTSRFRKERMSQQEMIRFLRRIQTVIEEVEEYLLNPNRLLLDPDLIFLNGEEYEFCYCPGGEEEIRVSFHRLMDCFVQWTDYQDVPSVKTAFLLHRETMEENYSLKHIEEKVMLIDSGEEQKELSECTVESDSPEEEQTAKRKEKDLWQTEVYDPGMYEWISEQRKTERIMEEEGGFFRPVRRLLGRRKRAKWGEWKDLYMQDEKL